jgi:hypothetical protein
MRERKMLEKENNNQENFLEKFKKRFQANKIAVESVLFENEKRRDEKKDFRYWYYFFGIYVLNILINYIYFLKNSDFSLNINDIKAYEYLKSYLNENLINIFKFSFLNGINFDMPIYYLLYALPIKIFGFSYPFSIFFINSFIFFFISLGLYWLILKTRNEKAALSSVIILSSLPSVFFLERHFSPILLTSAFVLWSYYFYIKSEKLDDARNLHIFVIIYSLGVLSDKFFIIYTIPMIGFLNILLTTVYWDYVAKVLFPSLVIYFVFLIRFLLIGFFSIPLLKKLSFNFSLSFYLKEIINSFSAFYFYPFILLFVWMIFAKFMIYEPRKILLKWFLYPLIVICFIPFINPNNIFPLIFPIIIGTSIMVSPYIRKYFNYVALLMMFINGFSLFYIKTSSEFNVIGYEKNYFKEDIEIITKAIKNDADSLDLGSFKNKGIVVSVDIKSDYINNYVLDYMKENFKAKNLIFVGKDPFGVFSNYIISDYEINNKNFKKIYRLKNIYVYRKIFDFCLPQDCSDKCYFDFLNISDIKFYGCLAENFKINDNEKIFDKVVINAKYINFKGIDIYGGIFKFENFAIGGDKCLSIKHFSSVNVISAKISNFSISRFFEDNFKDLEVKFFNDAIVLYKKIGGFTFSYYLSLYLKNEIVYIKVDKFEINGLGIPFVNHFANFMLDINKIYIPLHIKSLKITEDFTILK